MRVVLRWGAALLVALVLGLGSAWWTLRQGVAAATVRNGAWQTSRETGSPDAGMYIRAQVAVAGLLALSQQEAMYYRAASDDAGNPLVGDCDFLVEGSDPATRWWSLTAYAADHFLIPNPVERYSFSRTTVGRESDGRYRIVVSARPHEGNWLPVAPGAPFDLTLRLYNPEPSLLADLSGAPLPRITRIGCP